MQRTPPRSSTAVDEGHHRRQEGGPDLGQAILIGEMPCVVLAQG